MITNKIIKNKFYLYKKQFCKVCNIDKKSGFITVKYLGSDVSFFIPIVGCELLLSRLYTIGDLCRIVAKRPDTLRKYERRGLVLKPSQIISDEKSCYKNWRFYTESEVYDVVSFFSVRSAGRPPTSSSKKINSGRVGK